jgi:hypothetical protein
MTQIKKEKKQRKSACISVISVPFPTSQLNLGEKHLQPDQAALSERIFYARYWASEIEALRKRKDIVDRKEARRLLPHNMSGVSAA